MMRLLYTEQKKRRRRKNLREKIYQEVGITLPCTGAGKNEAGISELAGNITFRNILFFIRAVSDGYAFNNIHPCTKERITQALGT